MTPRRLVICTGPACRMRGSRWVARAAHQTLERDLRWRVIRSSCLHLCPKGPIAICYPGGQWYVNVKRHHLAVIVRRAIHDDGETASEPTMVFRFARDDAEEDTE